MRHSEFRPRTLLHPTVILTTYGKIRDIGTPQLCINLCNAEPGCKSFTHCGRKKECWLSKLVVYKSTATRDFPGFQCQTWYKEEDPFVCRGRMKQGTMPRAFFGIAGKENGPNGWRQPSNEDKFGACGKIIPADPTSCLRVRYLLPGRSLLPAG